MALNEGLAFASKAAILWEERDMYDLTFIEFSKEKTMPKRGLGLELPSNSFGFVCAMQPEEISKTKDVTSLFSRGRYDFKTPYFIFFLYDLYDKESVSFIADYGGKLHNLSSSNVTILTFFEKSVAEKWRNVQQRSEIRCQENVDPFKVSQALNILMKRFDVSSLPSLILTKKDGDGDKSIVIPLGKTDAASTYRTFETVIEVINDSCEEDFSVLSKKLLGYDASSVQEDAYDDVANSTYVYNFLGEMREKDGRFKFGRLYESLGVSRKTFYNKRVNSTFTRDECLKLGIIFGLDDDALNKLLRSNDQRELSFGEKDRKVKEAIREGKEFEDVEYDIFE